MSADGGVRALVVYESMFGCTKRVAGAVADGLRQEGVEVQLAEVGQAAPAGGTGFDLLVVGAPTHAFSLSRPESRADAVQRGAPPGVATTGLREWLEATPRTASGEHRLAAAFDTRVTKVRRFPKAASTGAARLLRRHGYTLVARPAPFLVQGTQGPLVEGELERAASWGRLLARVAAERSTPPPARAR